MNNPTIIYFCPLGGVVQIGDSTSRGCWRLGRITRLNESRDKAIHSAGILLANKHTVHRPLNALYPLEETSVGTKPSSSSPDSSTSQLSGSRASPFGKTWCPGGARAFGCVYLTFKLFFWRLHVYFFSLSLFPFSPFSPKPLIFAVNYFFSPGECRWGTHSHSNTVHTPTLSTTHAPPS